MFRKKPKEESKTVSTLAEALLEESSLLLLFLCHGARGGGNRATRVDRREGGGRSTELDGGADGGCLRSVAIGRGGTSVLAALTSAVAVGAAVVLFHDGSPVIVRQAVVVGVAVHLLRGVHASVRRGSVMGAVDGAVLAAGISRVVPGPGAVACHAGLVRVVVVVALWRVHAVAALRAARCATHALVEAVAAGRCQGAGAVVLVSVGTSLGRTVVASVV